MARAQAKYELVAEDRSERAFRSFRRSLGDSAKSFARFAGGIGLGVGSLAAMARGALNSADRIQKLAIQTGASTEFLSEMRFVASQAGTDMESVAKAVRGMQRSLKNANDGLKTSSRAFEQLGLDVGALLELHPDQQITAIGDALSKVENASLRGALAQEIFGRAGRELLPIFENGAAGLEKMRAEAQSLGLSMSRDMADGAAAANDALDRLTKGFGGLVEQMALQFAPGLADVVDSLRTNVLPAVQTIAGVIGSIARAAGGIAAAGAAAFSGDFAVAGNILREVFGDLFDGEDDDGKGREALDALREIAGNTRDNTARAG